MSLARKARLIEATRRGLSFWDAAERLGSFALQGEPRPIERPSLIASRPQQLQPRRWPNCVLCGLDVNHCDCDPDVAQAAALASMGAK